MSAANLEDDFTEVIKKAQEGLQVDDNRLAAKSGVTVEALRELKGGKVDDDALERIAPWLGLSTPALIELAHNRWQPARATHLDGLICFQSPCRTGSAVNSYLMWDPGTLNGVCFDTGTDAAELLTFVRRRGIRLQLVLITHSHADHIGALQPVIAATDARAFANKEEGMREVETFEPGRYFIVGNIMINTRAAPGHSRGGAIYIVSGLTRRVAIIGDSLFAGSMGRAFYSYTELLRTNCERILTLPEDTILCPGHGPMTTVGQEKLHNAFFAEQPATWAQAA